MCFAPKPLFQAPPISAIRPIISQRPLMNYAKPALVLSRMSGSNEPLQILQREKKAFWEDYNRPMERMLPRLEIVPIGPPDYKKILRDMTKPLGT